MNADYAIIAICAKYATLVTLNSPAQTVMFIIIMYFMKQKEITMIRRVVSKDQMVANIHAYNQNLERTKDRMPYVRAWYALPTTKGWLFGPSKFIGYQKMTPKEYIERADMELDGRATESILQQWAEPISKHYDSRYGELWVALNELCGRLGKKPNSLARISVVEDDDRSKEAISQDELVELLAAVYRRLSPEQRSVFQRVAGLRG